MTTPEVAPLELLLGLAFGAGVLGFFSPCSVAMLPAYISYHIGAGAREVATANGSPAGTAADGGPPWRVVPIVVGLMAASGILLLAAVVNSLVQGVVGVDPSQVPLVLSAAGLMATAFGMAVVAGRGGSGFGQVRGGLSRGLAVGTLSTAGLTTVYGALGAAILAGSSLARSYLPEVAFGTAAAMVVLGLSAAVGRPLSMLPPLRAPRVRGSLFPYLLGVAYGLVSAGCNLPIFLLVAGIALQAAVSMPAAGLLIFLAYAGGNALVLVPLSAYVAVAHRTTLPRVRGLTPYLERGAGLAIVAMGLYILWYDLTFVL